MKRYFDDYNFLLESWLEDQGIPDSLWRTAIYSIINPGHTINLYSCFKMGRVYRHPLDSLRDYNDCSRDQTVMALTAMKINNMPIPDVNYRISDKFTMGDSWLWYKAIKGSRFHSALFLTLWRIMLPILFKWNDLLWWYVQKMHTANDKKNIYWRWQFPFYAFHLLSWMIYCLPDSRAKRKLNNYCYHQVERQDFGNHLLKALHSNEYAKMFEGSGLVYAAHTDFRWQRNAFRLPPGVHLDKYDGPFQIDADILKVI